MSIVYQYSHLYEHYIRISCWLRCTFSLPAGRICTLMVHLGTSWQTSPSWEQRKFSAGSEKRYRFFKIINCKTRFSLQSDIFHAVLCKFKKWLRQVLLITARWRQQGTSLLHTFIHDLQLGQNARPFYLKSNTSVIKRLKDTARRSHTSTENLKAPPSLI